MVLIRVQHHIFKYSKNSNPFLYSVKTNFPFQSWDGFSRIPANAGYAGCMINIQFFLYFFLRNSFFLMRSSYILHSYHFTQQYLEHTTQWQSHLCVMGCMHPRFLNFHLIIWVFYTFAHREIIFMHHLRYIKFC